MLVIEPVPLHVEQARAAGLAAERGDAHALATGVHRNPDRVPAWFTTAAFHRPDELRAEVAEAGFEHVQVVGVEGPAWLLGDLAGWLDDGERRALLLDHLARIEAEPSLLGASAHLLAPAHSSSG